MTCLTGCIKSAMTAIPPALRRAQILDRLQRDGGMSLSRPRAGHGRVRGHDPSRRDAARRAGPGRARLRRRHRRRHRRRAALAPAHRLGAAGRAGRRGQARDRRPRRASGAARARRSSSTPRSSCLALARELVNGPATRPHARHQLPRDQLRARGRAASWSSRRRASSTSTCGCSPAAGRPSSSASLHFDIAFVSAAGPDARRRPDHLAPPARRRHQHRPRPRRAHRRADRLDQVRPRVAADHRPRPGARRDRHRRRPPLRRHRGLTAPPA